MSVEGISFEEIGALIRGSRIQYYHFPGTTMTAVCVTLPNGFSAIGYSACIVPENYNKETGEKLAMEKAKDMIISHYAFYLMTTR